MDGQKYKFADVVVGLPFEDKKVTVALLPQETLGFEDDGFEDNQIFYYFNGYEEFLEHLTKPAIFTSCDDFTIRRVIELYEEL